MRCTLLFFWLTVGWFFAGYGQLQESAFAEKAFYRNVHSGGAFMHTRGFGVFYQRGWRQTAFVNRVLQFELLNVRHPKELKYSLAGQQNARGYFYGKLNSASFFRPTFGWQKMLFDKEVKRGVRVSQLFTFGPTIAFLKPTYLEVDPNTDEDQQVPLFVKASASIYNSDTTVLSRAPMLTGLNQTRIVPGLHVKFALNFEYSASDATLHCLELGGTFDGFFFQVPIMASTYNDQFYLGIYLAYQFGKRYTD